MVDGAMAESSPVTHQGSRLPSQRQQEQSRFHSSIQAENSILLRVLVQALVVVGILATDIAAIDVSEPTWVSLWAIPASGVGAFYSWRRRQDRNITLKFILAIAMLVVLAGFFAQVLQQLNDTRLVLAELLIQLQVVHSFDLPRRKDLGYSVVIGLILLAVAATLSQTLSFAPLLVVFLAIALPVLILDYRSRLGAEGLIPKRLFLKTDLAPHRLGALVLVTLVLGLVVFAALPRLPGYQLRTFPVSATLDIEGEFDSSQVRNPGYIGGELAEGGDGGGGSGVEQTDETDRGPDSRPGTIDGTFYYGFNSRINQNLRGSLEPTMVMRVRSQARGFWRVLAFDHYLGQGWEISRNEQTEVLDRPSWSFRYWLPQRYALGPSKKVAQTYTITADLPNLIPALYQAESLFFPTEQVALDWEGGLRSPVELTEGLTYTVISEVPYRNRTALGQTSSIYPQAIQEYYLQVPKGIQDRLQQYTETVLGQSEKPITVPYEQALYLAQYLKQHYTLQPELPFLNQDEDLVEAFLLKFEGGYPDHFSTTLTLLLRSIGIPARLVVGFAPGEFNPFTGYYLVRNTDAYAMTEVFFPNYGWFAFDPIPGHDLVPPSFEDNYTFSALRSFWNWVADWFPSPVRGVLSGVLHWGQKAIAQILSGVLSVLNQGWLGLFGLLVLTLILGLLGWLTWLAWGHWRDRRRLAQLPPMERLYQQMLRWLAIQGWPKHPAQTPLEYAQNLGDRQSPLSYQAVQDICRAYVRWRYGNYPPNLGVLSRQLQHLRPRIGKGWASFRFSPTGFTPGAHSPR